MNEVKESRLAHTHLKEGFFVKKFKKVIALSLALAMGLSLVACNDKEEKDATTAAATDDATEATEATEEGEAATLAMPETEGDVIYVYSWNTELGDRLKYFTDKYPEYADRVEYVNLGVGGTSVEYKTQLETLITAGNTGDQYPSIIAMDNDVAKGFLESDYTVSMDSIGITPAMYENAFDYTVNYATVGDELKALTWQSTPGCFIYRTDIAEEVLGSSDPADVQEAVKDWDTFFATADTMKAAGYSMVSGPDDIKYAMLDQKSSPWVQDDKLNIDTSVTDYLETAKKLYDGGYTQKTAMWSDAWNANFQGDVFGYFGCTWFVYWCIKVTEEDDLYGKFNMCTGPVAYHWGGSYLAVTEGCPDKALAALVLYTLCCDTETMAKLSEETFDFVNNKAAIQSLIDAGKGASPVLGGQNPLETWLAAGDAIDLSNATAYDSVFNGYLDTASLAYNSGDAATIDDAVQSIKDQVADGYSYITVE